jgi:hypothetical protein
MRAYLIANRERLNAQAVERYAKNPDPRAYYRANREKIQAGNRRWRAAHPEWKPKATTRQKRRYAEWFVGETTDPAGINESEIYDCDAAHPVDEPLSFDGYDPEPKYGSLGL